MFRRFLNHGSFGIFARTLFASGMLFFLLAQRGASQEPPTAASEAKIEVVTRGPIHEAFATVTTFEPMPSVVADSVPPPAVEEIPPSVKPSGNNVLWIPGYWGWDAEAKEFIWVSGLWRAMPPEARWIPGYWQPLERGAQWYSGFWINASTDKIVYLSAPPKTLERGPASPGDDASQFYVPGCWEPHEGRYRWRPGYWVPYQPGWVWTPARYVVAASGYVYVPGYWDYRLGLRAQLYSPLRITGAVVATGGIRHVPSDVLDLGNLQLHLFTRARSIAYLFGDYYDARFDPLGIRPWYEPHDARVSVDPLLTYTAWASLQNGENYVARLRSWHKYYVEHAAMRPAATLAGQVELAKLHQGAAHLSASILSLSLEQVVDAAPDRFIRLAADEHAAVTETVRGLKLVAADRLKVEGAVRAANATVATGQSIRLPIDPLGLPAVVIPSVSNATSVTGGLLGGTATRVVPAEPTRLLRGIPAATEPVESFLREGDRILPRLPF